MSRKKLDLQTAKGILSTCRKIIDDTKDARMRKHQFGPNQEEEQVQWEREGEIIAMGARRKFFQKFESSPLQELVEDYWVTFVYSPALDKPVTFEDEDARELWNISKGPARRGTPRMPSGKWYS